MSTSTKIELKKALKREPSRLAWNSVCQILDELEGPDLNWAIESVNKALEKWPQYLRNAPQNWARNLAMTGTEPRLQVARSLNLTGCRGYKTTIENVSQSADMAQIKSLIFSLNTIKPKNMKLLAASPHLSGVESMQFSLCFMKDTGLNHFSKSTTITGLKFLDLRNNDLGERGGKIVAKAKSEVFSNLETLKYNANRLEDAGARWLSEAKLPSLRCLSLVNNNVTAEGISLIANSKTLTGLSRLDLSDYRTRKVSDLDALAGTPLIERLEEFHWEGHEEKRGELIGRLVNLEGFNGLRVLKVREQGLGDGDIEALVATPQLKGVEELDLSSSSFSSEALSNLAQSPVLQNVKRLDLGNCTVDDEGLKALVSSRHLENLRELHLFGNPITSRSVEALASATFASNLTSLELYATPLGDAGAQAIAKASSLSNLEFLGLSETEITDQGAQAIAGAAHLSTLHQIGLNQKQPLGKKAEKALQESPYLSEVCKSTLNIR